MVRYINNIPYAYIVKSYPSEATHLNLILPLFKRIERISLGTCGQLLTCPFILNPQWASLWKTAAMGIQDSSMTILYF